jgi:hypothetical protein
LIGSAGQENFWHALKFFFNIGYCTIAMNHHEIILKIYTYLFNVLFEHYEISLGFNGDTTTLIKLILVILIELEWQIKKRNSQVNFSFICSSLQKARNKEWPSFFSRF